MSASLSLRCGTNNPQLNANPNNSSPLLLEFNKQGDRFAHRLCIPSGSSHIPVLKSHTLDPTAPWPSDPPLQQVVFEPLGPNQENVALGVGLAGHGHWSLAARCCEAPNSIEIDFACRITRPTPFLGSTYQVIHQPSQQSTQNDVSLVHVANNQVGWTAQWKTKNGNSLTLQLHATIGTLLWDPSNFQLQVLPQSLPQTPIEKPTTLRWCYHISLSA